MPNVNKPELLACPFCGCAGSLSAFQGSEDENPSAYAFCLDCVVQTRTCIHRDAAVAESLAIAAWNRRTASPVAPEGAAPTPPSEAVTPGQRPAPYHDTGTCVVCDGRRSGKPPFGDGTPGEPPRCDRCPHPPHVGACHGRLGHTAYQCVCIYDTVPSASATTEGPRGETKETG